MRAGERKESKGKDAGKGPAGDEGCGNIVIWEYLDLVALGTVADICPLVDENRILVVHGLAQMEQNLRPGLKALCKVAALNREKITVGDLAYIISPRLNAAGRLGDASRSLHLLLEEEREQAERIAEELHEENKRRQALEQNIFNEACSMVEGRMTFTRSILSSWQARVGTAAFWGYCKPYGGEIQRSRNSPYAGKRCRQGFGSQRMILTCFMH